MKDKIAVDYDNLKRAVRHLNVYEMDGLKRIADAMMLILCDLGLDLRLRDGKWEMICDHCELGCCHECLKDRGIYEEMRWEEIL
jgi:hypothetical protein